MNVMKCKCKYMMHTMKSEFMLISQIITNQASIIDLTLTIQQDSKLTSYYHGVPPTLTTQTQRPILNMWHDEPYYTPISDPKAKGYFDLLIKVYPEGKMSQHFARLKPGDILEVKGPIEKLRYSPNMKKHIGMIAGGSGITPMLQVIDAILKNPDDNTQVSLVYANVSPDDILLKKKLDVLAATHPNLKVFYTVDNPTNDWKGGIGYVSKDMIVKGLPPPGDDTLILNKIDCTQSGYYGLGSFLPIIKNLECIKGAIE
ncbi:hypothetical protein HAX54_005937 [Datura stramonium]|uniref:cytochrome-b5 reductase n=1 Tax=Datura stramonium TaxID=4076 RepID=A0ABS8T9P9_DATST|nr:hypothetical protein [Datura stramonium]